MILSKRDEKLINFTQSISLYASVIILVIGVYYLKFGQVSNQYATILFLSLACSMSVYIFATTKKIHTDLNNQTTESRKITDNVGTILIDVSNIKNELAAQKWDFEDFKDLYNNYISIPYGKTISECKKQQVAKLAYRLQELKYKNHITFMTPEESFDLSTPMLKNLTTGDEVIAVTFLENEKGEWENHPYWNEYIDAQILAAKNNASVTRIFITDLTKLDNALQTLLVAKIHTVEQFNEKQLIGFFLDNKIYENYPDDIKHWIGQGFIFINSHSTKERMAVIDNFYHKTNQKNLDYRTTVNFNEHDLNQIEISFGKINKNLPRLSMQAYCTENLHTKDNT